MNGDLIHDVVYLVTGAIIWPICCLAGFIVGLFDVVKKQ